MADYLQDELPRLLAERAAAAAGVKQAESALAEAQRELEQVNREIAELLEQSGVLAAQTAPGTPRRNAEGRYLLVWRLRDGQPDPQGTPDPGTPVLAAGRPITFANRQSKLAPLDAYEAAIGTRINATALVDQTTGEAVDLAIDWGKPRGRNR